MEGRIAESVIVHGDRVCDIIIIPKRLPNKIGRVAEVIADFIQLPSNILREKFYTRCDVSGKVDAQLMAEDAFNAECRR